MQSHTFRYLLFVVLPALLATTTLLVRVALSGRWWIELLSFTMPLVLLATLLVLIAWLVIRPGIRWLWLPLLALLLALKPLGATFAFNLPTSEGDQQIRVMSFNAALFNPYRPSTLKSDQGSFRSFNSYLRSSPAPDILCIQEFYHGSSSADELTADSILSLGDYSYFYTNPVYNRDYDGLIGVITFSKHPIVASGKLDLGDPRFHNAHWNDIAVDGDTVRVLNVQLRSMSIRWHPLSVSTLFSDLIYNALTIYRKLHRGHILRVAEMDRIAEALDASPYPAIICADLNALPYSHTYQRLKEKHLNAFEEKGSGFGFTYRHFPWFIRIDNQFYDPQLRLEYFRTRKEINVSDHYPIEAGYVLRKGS